MDEIEGEVFVAARHCGVENQAVEKIFGKHRVLLPERASRRSQTGQKSQQGKFAHVENHFEMRPRRGRQAVCTALD